MLPGRYMCEIAFPRTALEHFVEHGWAVFPYSGIPPGVRNAKLLELAQEFVQQPPERLRRFTLYVNREGNTEPDDGYIIKRGERRGSTDEYDVADRKTYFHYRTDIYTILPQDLYSSLSTLERCFLERCHDAYLFGIIGKLLLARELDRMFPEFRLYELVSSRRAMSLHVLRLLLYDVPQDQNARVVGKPHFDRDWVTSQLFQSDEGLHLIDPVSREDVVCGSRDDGIVFFCGDKMPLATGGSIDHAEYQKSGKRIVRGGRIPRVEHYVVNAAAHVRRRAVVFFAQTPHELPWGK